MIAHAPTVKAAKKPLFLSARVVDRLTEAAEVAALNEGVKSLVEAVLNGIARDFAEGDFGLILEGWDFGDDRAETENDLADLALRWQNEDKLNAEKEVGHE